MHHKWKEIFDILCKTPNGELQGTNSRWNSPLRWTIPLLVIFWVMFMNLSLFALKPNDRQVQAGLRFGLNVLDLWWKFSIWTYLLIYGGVFGQCIVQEPVNASEKHQSPWKLGTHSKCFWLYFILFYFYFKFLLSFYSKLLVFLPPYL